jgi:predicted nuclease of predicted toxin-antitoxin system
VLKFHLDEHVAHAIADGLRSHGIDVTTAAEVGLLGADDEDHIAFALQEVRVIFTNDRDFLAIAASGEPHAGITHCKVGARSIGYIIDALEFFSDELEPDDMMNRVEYL